VTKYSLLKFEKNLNFSANLGFFSLGATPQHVHLSFLYTFHACSSHIYQHTTNIRPIAIYPTHEHIDNICLGSIYLLEDLLLLELKFCRLRKNVELLSKIH
jgi:hypothetical protein